MVTIADTSVWVDHLRGRRTARTARLHSLMGDGLATTDVVVMELLMGARDSADAAALRSLLNGCEYLPVEARDFESAAALYRRCRRAGSAPRSIGDTLIAAVAIRADVAILHNDRDFDLIARHVELRIDVL